MITQIKNFIQEKQEKITKIALITIAVIILLIIFSIQVQSYIKISKAKQELIQEEKTKNEYTLKLINGVQEYNKKIPEFETKIRILKLKNRCYNDQIERKKNNKIIEINFCEKKENYEKYSEKNNKEKPQEVAFSFISKVNADEGANNSQLSKKQQKQNKIYHKDWDKNDEKQKTLNKLYKISNGDLDFVGTVLGENGNLNPTLRSYIVGNNGYYDRGICQINKGYHPEIVKDPNFKDVDFQVKKCWELYKGGTKFYGKRHKEKMISKLIINEI